jgi:hypothetical protein
MDIKAGSAVISALDEAQLHPTVALWMTTPEYEDDPRLAISSPHLDQENPLRAYEQVADVLHGKFSHTQPSIMLFRVNDPFIKRLRQLFGDTESVEGMRLGGQMIGNRFLTDAYVYRIR